MSFIFGGNTGTSYDEIQRKRAIADQLIALNSRTPQNVGEGLTAVGNALRARRLNKQAGEADKQGRAAFNSKWANIAGMLSGGGAPSGISSAPSGISSAPIPADPKSPQGIGADAMAALIKTGLMDRGLPEHVADGFVMNMKDESGLNPGINEISPIVPGSRGGFGLAQWTGPRRKALEEYAAVNKADVGDMNTQLDFLMTELQGPEANAAREILASSDPNSAAAAIASKFLRPAPENLERRLAQYGSAQPANMDLAQLTEIAGNPYASPEQKAIVQQLMQQQLQAQDPAYQMGLEKSRLELEALRNPTPKDTRTDDIREYEFAKSQGYDGTFQQFMTEMKSAGATKINNTVSNGGEPTTQDVLAAGATDPNAMIGSIDSILNDPKLDSVVGPLEGGGGNDVDQMGAARRMYYGGEGLALIQRIKQLQDTTFLGARAMLKGGGAITDYEGKKAEAAMARLSRAQDEASFRAALTDLRDAIKAGEAKLRAAGKLPSASGGNSAAPSATHRFNPDTGEIEAIQ